MNLIFRLLLMLIKSPFKQRMGFFDTCETKFIAVPTDLDLNFHVNNGVFLSLMDLGRIDYILKSRLLKIAFRQSIYPLVASQMIRYNKSINMFSRFIIRTDILGWDEKFFYLKQEFVSLNDEKIAVAVVKARFKSRKTGGVNPADFAVLCNVDPVSPTLPEWVEEWKESEKKMIN